MQIPCELSTQDPNKKAYEISFSLPYFAMFPEILTENISNNVMIILNC